MGRNSSVAFPKDRERAAVAQPNAHERPIEKRFSAVAVRGEHSSSLELPQGGLV